MAEYIGFDGRADMLRQFEESEDALDGFEVLYAEYDTGNWEGSAWVLLRRVDGELFEVNGRHCSCEGLEGQWDPEPMPAEVVRLRITNPSSQGSAFLTRLFGGGVSGGDG